MNHLWTKIIISLLKPNQRRSLSLTATNYARKRKNNCEEVDCCGNVINAPEKPKYMLEKSCLPCCFFTWKPKIPILKAPPPLVDVTVKPYKKQPCYAGMKIINQKLENKKKAAICQMACCAKNPICPKPPPPEPEVKVEEPVIMLPVADWDINANPLREICKSVDLSNRDPPLADCRNKTKN